MPPPYSRIASVYDCTVGFPFFLRVRDAFERLVRRYGIRFASAADIGCGTGLFACYLNRFWGVPVFAVDRSGDMLRLARRNCRRESVRFLQQDIRCLGLPSRVDLITANFDTLNHLTAPEDLRLAFQCVASNLQSAGHFYFDILTPCQPLRGLAYLHNYCTMGHWLRQQVRWEPRRRLMHISAVHRRSGSCRPLTERITERAYGAAELSKWLSESGFLIRGVHDEATLRVPADCPSRIIVVAQKTKGGAPD
ncbi:MAG: methyltransferase domain-containing protein [Candidatus Binatia bacterium]|jgi:SAM-dependent methyltransferase